MWPDDLQNAVVANWPIGAAERRIWDIVWTYTWTETPNPATVGTVWDHRNTRNHWGYEPSTPYWQSLSEQLWMVSRQDFNNLKDEVDRLKDDNIELRRQVSNLQSMVLNLDWLISEVKQTLRFRYVNNDNDR